MGRLASAQAHVWLRLKACGKQFGFLVELRGTHPLAQFAGRGCVLTAARSHTPQSSMPLCIDPSHSFVPGCIRSLVVLVFGLGQVSRHWMVLHAYAVVWPEDVMHAAAYSHLTVVSTGLSTLASCVRLCLHTPLRPCFQAPPTSTPNERGTAVRSAVH